MSRPFDYFVVFAEMRTGSNHLETSLNTMENVSCYGELFNKRFIGYHQAYDFMGISMEARDKNPSILLNTLKKKSGRIPGFRYFGDHDPRILGILLDDPHCAKIILTRNPAESYISLKIAKETDQWLLRKINKQRSSQISFDAAEFENYLSKVNNFRRKVIYHLQGTGQTPFHIDYENINDLKVLRGLAAFLGTTGPKKLKGRLLRQNPGSVFEKVLNPDEMKATISKLDLLNITQVSPYEPRSNFTLSQVVATNAAPLMYLPIQNGLEKKIEGWISQFGSLKRNFDRENLKKWRENHPNHRLFTILRHPVARAYQAFSEYSTNGENLPIDMEIKRIFDIEMPRIYKPFPTIEVYRKGFITFVRWLKLNLSGQTEHTTLPQWSSQAKLLESWAQKIRAPDILIRDNKVETGLTFLTQELGLPCPPPPHNEKDKLLATIYDEEIEQVTHDTYARDYTLFGFDHWQK